MRKWTRSLGTWILVAMGLGILFGALLEDKAALVAPLGDLFMQLIKMLVIPLVTVSIIAGAASLGNTRSAGKIGILTFLYYLSTTAIAVILGLIFGAVFQPGSGVDLSTVSQMFSEQIANQGDAPGFWETLKGFIPENPFQALVQGNILQLLFFCLFFGFGLSTLPVEKKTPVVNLFHHLSEALIWMIGKVMWLAPLGVFGLIADAVGTFGYEILQLVLKLFFIYLAALTLQTFVVYPSYIKLLSRLSPMQFIKAIGKAQVVALSTSSSMATLPVTMKVCEKELGVSNESSSFILPLGATINMDGNAIYYSLVAMFFAQFFGIELGVGEIIAIILTATIGSIGQAGVPGPTLLVVAVLLAANIPVAGLPILFGVDRLFDMLRTVTNITGDSTCAVIVDQVHQKELQTQHSNI
ncbi:cation:dicarboxylase symporter family transporter [candidate division KSB1 bacterium]|nr:cation:dicarboxylase symporter family transporter [candidate division KSB1 bacterium]